MKDLILHEDNGCYEVHYRCEILGRWNDRDMAVTYMMGATIGAKMERENIREMMEEIRESMEENMKDIERIRELLGLDKEE